jgi:hypothetical protein
MPNYVVETYVPAGSRDAFAHAVDDLRSASEASGELRLVRSFLVPGDEMGFHVVEARTATDVETLTAVAGIEPERIVEMLPVEGAAGEGPS